MAGNAPKSLERCGRIGDGWLPAMCTPHEVDLGRTVIHAAASQAGREISDEHFGVSIAYCTNGYPDQLAKQIARRLGDRRLEDVVPARRQEVAPLLERFIAAGFSKFVLRPLLPVADWDEELSLLAPEVLFLEN